MNRRQIIAAFVVVFVVPPIVMVPFQSQLQQIVPAPTLWQSVGMVLGLLVIFVLGVQYWNLRQRVEEID